MAFAHHMKKTVFILCYAVVALAIFGYGQTAENKQLSYLLNGQYAKKMTDASEKLKELDVAVQKTLLFNESDGFDRARDDIWRLSADVKSSVGSLPVDRGFSNSWMNYLGRLGNYAKEADRLENKEEYHKVMTEASVNLREMADEWQVATRNLVSGQLTVEGWRNQLDSIDANHDWEGMRDTVKQYTESDFPLTASESDALKKKELQTLTDEEVTKEEAIERFKILFPEVSQSALVVENSRPDAPYPFYHIRFAEGQSVGYIDITEKGGHVLSFLSERPFGKEVQSYPFIEKKAKKFLQDAGYTDAVLEEARENDTSWHFVFVRQESEYDALVFSDAIHLKVAKDTGGIVGLDAMEYIQKENLNKQPIVQTDWQTYFRPHVAVVDEKLAYVENDRMEQRLAHYLTVTLDTKDTIETYVVVVDTETAEVIKTEKQL